MDLLTLFIIVLIVLALSGAGYGAYAGPVGGGANPLVGGLGLIALVLIIALVFMLATGWRFGFQATPPM